MSFSTFAGSIFAFVGLVVTPWEIFNACALHHNIRSTFDSVHPLRTSLTNSYGSVFGGMLESLCQFMGTSFLCTVFTSFSWLYVFFFGRTFRTQFSSECGMTGLLRNKSRDASSKVESCPSEYH